MIRFAPENHTISRISLSVSLTGEKNINTKPSTVVKEIGNITNVNLENPKIKDNTITSQIIGVNIKKTTYCVACNKVITIETEEDIYTCNNCSMTTLISLCNTKVVAHIVLKTSNDISTYVAFNDGKVNFLANIKYAESSLSQLQASTKSSKPST